MKDIILYGSGGMAREVVELIEDINSVKATWNILGYIDDTKDGSGEIVNGYRILGTSDILRDKDVPKCVVLALSNPAAKESIIGRIGDYGLEFPTLIHPSVKIARSAVIGEGTVIGIDCIVSTGVTVGRHVFMNMRTVVGHDTVIGDYCTCLVNSILAGGVHVREGVLLGSGCIIMEKKTIGRKAKVGMGSIVDCDVEEGHVVMSRPSRSIYFGK